MIYQKAFRLEGLPKTINALGRAHWALKKKETDYWKRCVFLATRGKTPPTPLKRAKITYTRFSAQPCDFDGLVSSFKHVQDGLVASGIIENDTLKHITPSYFWLKGKQRHGYITIVVEELPFIK